MVNHSKQKTDFIIAFLAEVKERFYDKVEDKIYASEARIYMREAYLEAAARFLKKIRMANPAKCPGCSDFMEEYENPFKDERISRYFHCHNCDLDFEYAFSPVSGEQIIKKPDIAFYR